MADVEFLEENTMHVKSVRLLGDTEQSTMSNFLINAGIAKTKRSADLMLILLVVVLFAMVFHILRGRSGPSVNYIEDQYGNRYTAEQYINELDAGRNPLAPNN